MASYFINFDTIVNRTKNDTSFILLHIDRIIEIHKEQRDEEMGSFQSYKQYDALLHHVAYTYCLHLFFITLEKLEEESIEESEERHKKEYRFDEIQTNLAHKDIDLDRIYEQIKINYIPVEYEN